MTNILELSDVEFAYQKNLVFSGLNLKMKAGESLYIHGPSGCGKSTMLGLIAGTLTPRQGYIGLDGIEWHTLSSSKKDRLRAELMGYIFQSFNLIPYLNVEDNIRLSFTFAKTSRLSRLELQERLEQLTQKLNIFDLLDKSVIELSVGQQQRVAAVRALIHKPKLLIADEPTSALDTNNREAFLKTLLSEAQKSNMAVLFVSHDPSLAGLFERRASLSELTRS